MKKDLKKKIEKDVVASIEKVLSKHHPKAAAKAGKAIRNAAKAIVKKFGKGFKTLAPKAKSVKKGNKKAATGSKSKKNKAEKDMATSTEIG